MNQRELIRNHMMTFGSITTWDAFIHYGCTRLSSRIVELKKDGYSISSKTETAVNRFGDLVSYKRYWLNAEKTSSEGTENPLNSPGCFEQTTEQLNVLG